MDTRKYKELLEVINDLKLDMVEKIDQDKPKFKFEYAFESITERNTKYRRRNAHA